MSNIIIQNYYFVWFDPLLAGISRGRFFRGGLFKMVYKFIFWEPAKKVLKFILRIVKQNKFIVWFDLIPCWPVFRGKVSFGEVFLKWFINLFFENLEECSQIYFCELSNRIILLFVWFDPFLVGISWEGFLQVGPWKIVYKFVFWEPAKKVLGIYFCELSNRIILLFDLIPC